MILAASTSLVGVATSLKSVRVNSNLLLMAGALALALSMLHIVHALGRRTVEAAAVVSESVRLTEVIASRCVVLPTLLHVLRRRPILGLLSILRLRTACVPTGSWS